MTDNVEFIKSINGTFILGKGNVPEFSFQNARKLPPPTFSSRTVFFFLWGGGAERDKSTVKAQNFPACKLSIFDSSR